MFVVAFSFELSAFSYSPTHHLPQLIVVAFSFELSAFGFSSTHHLPHFITCRC
jgi:hypothetical protein